MKSEPMTASPSPNGGSLEELSAAVRAAVGSPTKFQMLSARLIIQIGVDLKSISAAQNKDPALQQRVREALARLGIHVGGSRP